MTPSQRLLEPPGKAVLNGEGDGDEAERRADAKDGAERPPKEGHLIKKQVIKSQK